MSEGIAAIDESRITTRLRQPLVPPEAGVFRLGLVLNGTVSAGAWTAGVLDFLIEALDLWENQKEEDKRRGDGPTVPDHHVHLGVAGGASGGGVCAALLARASGWDFPNVSGGDIPANHDNPFWRVWVEELDISKMLGTEDLAVDGAVPISLLSGAAIEAAGNFILTWPGPAGKPRNRTWLSDPLRIFVTLTNLRGVPYRIQLQTDKTGQARSSFFVDHADYGLFAFSPNGQDRATLALRDDEHLVRSPDDWADFAEFVKATGAFPGGFPPRRLTRPVADYIWRGVALPGQQGQAPRIVLRLPAWDALTPPVSPEDDYTFECVDGGALNNQPVELVRTALSGLGGSNPRDPKQADAAVVLIDPFAAVPRCEPPMSGERRDLLGVLGGLASAWVDHGRFATSDLLLAVEPDVFSRFLLTANDNRNGKPRHGGAALATNGLGAFIGFFSRKLRVHDFMLGRENCRSFLMNELVLHKDNPLFRGFADRHPDVTRNLRPTDMGSDWLPIIPVVPPLRVPQPVPAWPVGAVDPAPLHKSIENRLGLVLRRLLENNNIEIPFEHLLINTLIDTKLADAVEKQIKKAVADEGLA
jgi:Patatin-like phospholipase